LYLIDETIPYSLEYYLGIKRDYYEDEECNSCGESEEDSEEDEHDKMPKRKKSGGVKKKSEDEIEKKNV